MLSCQIWQVKVHDAGIYSGSTKTMPKQSRALHFLTYNLKLIYKFFFIQSQEGESNQSSFGYCPALFKSM